MASKKITYTDVPEGDDVLKSNNVAIVDREHQASAEDFNEIAKVVNSNADLLDQNIAQTEVNTADIESIVDNMVTKDMIDTNITLFPTNVEGDFGYLVMVTSMEDPNYNDVAVDVMTGEITANNQLVGQLISSPGLINGSIDYISVPTIGNIAKISGNINQYCSFYFKIFKRDSEGVETLIGTSTPTNAVNPVDSDYHLFSASALIVSDGFTDTDRVVIKYYTTSMNHAGAYYQFQFGGVVPVHTDIVVPSTIVTTKDTQINVTTENFSGILSETDTKLNTALETIDQHNHDHDSLRGLDQGSLKHMSLVQEAALSDYVQKTVKLKSGNLGVGTNTIATIPMDDGYGAVIEYAIVTTMDITLRVGLMYVAWNGSNVNKTDTSTVDLGTSTETFSFNFVIDGTDVLFQSVVTSGIFVVKCSIRLI